MFEMNAPFQLISGSASTGGIGEVGKGRSQGVGYHPILGVTTRREVDMTRARTVGRLGGANRTCIDLTRMYRVSRQVGRIRNGLRDAVHH